MVRIFIAPIYSQNVTVSGPPALKLYAGNSNPNGRILNPQAGELYMESTPGKVGSTWVNVNGTQNGWVQLSTGGSGGSFWTLSGNNLYPTTIGNNVGIKTTTPAKALDVNGGINSSGVDSFYFKLGNGLSYITTDAFKGGNHTQIAGWENIFYPDLTAVNTPSPNYLNAYHIVDKACEDVDDFNSHCVRNMLGLSITGDSLVWLYEDIDNNTFGIIVGSQGEGQAVQDFRDKNSINFQYADGTNLVTINTTTDAGYFQYLGGSPQLGKVLTSDVAGIASWQNIDTTLTLTVSGNGSDPDITFHYALPFTPASVDYPLPKSVDASTFPVYNTLLTSTEADFHFNGGNTNAGTNNIVFQVRFHKY